eukprot:409749_1
MGSHLCCSAYLEWEKEQERYNIQQKVNAQIIDEINNESVFVVGNNIHGELTFKYQSVPYLVNFTQHNREYITNIYSGRYCTFYTDKYFKNIFVSGNNQNFTCVNDYPSIFNSSLDVIQYFRDHNITIKQICVNHVSLSTFWITTNNEIYGNGINKNGELGIGNHRQYIWPELIPSLSNGPVNVLDIKSNPSISLALCSTNPNVIKTIVKSFGFINMQYDIIKLILKFYEINSVYSTSSFGDGEKCHNTIWNKIDIFTDKHILKIGIGLKHSLILEDNGTVYCFGSNTFGELGIGDSTEYEEILKPIPIGYFLENKIRITDIKCGSEHNLCIDNNGKIYSFGLNASKQCGISGKSFIFKPQIIQSLKELKIIGIETGHRHSYCKSNNGKHFLFGSNEHNECLTYDGRKKVCIPYCVNDVIDEICNGKYIKYVSLGYYNTKIIVRNLNKKFAVRYITHTINH